MTIGQKKTDKPNYNIEQELTDLDNRIAERTNEFNKKIETIKQAVRDNGGSLVKKYNGVITIINGSGMASNKKNRL